MKHYEADLLLYHNYETSKLIELTELKRAFNKMSHLKKSI